MVLVAFSNTNDSMILHGCHLWLNSSWEKQSYFKREAIKNQERQHFELKTYSVSM